MERRFDTMITAKIILDSINPMDVRLTTFELTYPRFIHSEFMTHRMLSRNAASSRAIPVEKMIAAVAENPAQPERWGANQKGMQAYEECSNALACSTLWNQARFGAIDHAKEMVMLGLHKQIANRLLEPWAHITVVCTGTEYKNFFALRAHPMAQPEFQVLAFRMLNAYLKSKPQNLLWGAWHLPYIRPDDEIELINLGIDRNKCLPKISAARCARVSYLNQNGVRNIDDDIALYDRLVAGKPLHASALEHPAKAWPGAKLARYGISGSSKLRSNFHPSWKQLRKQHPAENITELDLNQVMAEKPDWISL
jgi:thymidylate synthase ThyX